MGIHGVHKVLASLWIGDRQMCASDVVQDLFPDFRHDVVLVRRHLHHLESEEKLAVHEVCYQRKKYFSLTDDGERIGHLIVARPSLLDDELTFPELMDIAGGPSAPPPPPRCSIACSILRLLTVAKKGLRSAELIEAIGLPAYSVWPALSKLFKKELVTGDIYSNPRPFYQLTQVGFYVAMAAIEEAGPQARAQRLDHILTIRDRNHGLLLMG